MRWPLERTDFRFLEWMESEAFSLLTLILRVQAISRDDLVDLVSWPIDRLQDRWREAENRYQAAIDTANRIETNDDVVNYTPEAKADVLYLFSSNVSRVVFQNGVDHKLLASAALTVLKSIRSHRELMEVLRRMGREDGTKGSVADLKNNYVNLILRFLYKSPRAEDTEQWLSGLYS